MQLSEYKSWECGRGRVRHNTEMHSILCLLVTVMNISALCLFCVLFTGELCDARSIQAVKRHHSFLWTP